ncbi:10015_t:CDS:2, partial [Paraglomus occultum]
NFLRNSEDSRPVNFFMKFKYCSKKIGSQDYGLRLSEALQDVPKSEKLLNLKRRWEADEYRNDWSSYEDEREKRKADKKVKRRKCKAHVAFHEELDERLDGKKLPDTTVSSTSLASSSISNQQEQSFEFPGESQDNEEERVAYEELELHAEESIRGDEEKWIMGDTDLHDALTKWKQKKVWPRTDLGFYDIVDVTPGSNSDFVRSLPIDIVHEIRQSKSLPTIKMDDTDTMKQYIIDFIKTKDFRKFVDEGYMKTRINNNTKFIWDYLNLLVESFERDNDLADHNLSELGYREIFLSPLMRSLFRGMHRDLHIYFGEKCLFASSEDRNLEKNDEEDRSAGRKIDIIWSMKPTDLEFSISEVSGPPNQHNHTHFFNDKLKIAKMLKVIINRIVRKYGGAGMNLGLLKLNEIIVYEMSIPSHGIYVFCEVLRSKLPTNEVEVGLMLRSVPALLKFRKLLEESLDNLKDYIQDACTRTPDDNENACLFITHTDVTPTANRTQSEKKKK